jgi:glucose/arabinose dehydrogenase
MPGPSKPGQLKPSAAVKRRRQVQLGLCAGFLLLAAATLLYGCNGDRATLDVADGSGPTPLLPQPVVSLFPTVNVASVVGWQQNATPVAAPGLKVTALARHLQHPRWIYVLPNGDVLVAETEGPHFAADQRGLRGRIARLIMNDAGAGGDSANRIVLLRMTPIGVERYDFLKGLNSPFGMVLVGNEFYVANTDEVLRFTYHAGATSLGHGTVVTSLPGGPIDHHWTKGLIASADGSKLFVSIGSNSNVGENGMDAEAGRAAIWEVDRATGAHRIYASGLRNPVGMAFEPTSGALWTVVNERDELGSDLVPDYMTHVIDGAFYGWPYSYYGQNVDPRPQPQREDLVARAVVPDYALGPHTASLGLAFSRASASLPAEFSQGAFVGQHGSWNRVPRSGYKVIFVPFSDGKPSGLPRDVLTGFLNENGDAQGRPVGVALDRSGALLVADDVGNAVWRVTKK